MAGKRIKGITIEIDGDTKGLDKSLSDVDKSLKTTKDDLKDVNKLLKFDPKNTELLQQKQELLTKSIADTKERLSQLKTALSQMDAAGVDKNSEAYRGLQREIADTENQLKGLEKQSQSFGSVGIQQVQAVGKELQKVGGQITKVGEGLTKNVTAPLAAVGAASIAAFNDVDAGMDAVVTKTGATGDALAGMQDVVKNLATSIPTDFETAGNAVGEVNTRFGVTGDELEELSGQFIKFAQINGTDVSTSVDEVQKVLDAFGIASSYAGTQLDVLNRVGQNSGVSMETLTSDLVQNAAAFQEMGMSSNQAAVFIGQVEKSGIDTNAMMSGMSKALKNATSDGKSMKDALAEMQDTILNGTDSMDGLSAAYDLFGKSGAAVYNAVAQGSLDFTALADSADIMSDSVDSVSQTFDSTLDPIDQWQLTLNQMKETGAEVGNSLMTVLQPVLEKVADAFADLSAWWQSLDPEAQNTIVTVGLIATALGPVLVIIGQVITAIGTVMAAINPVTLTIAAIVAAIAAVIAIIQNWSAICDWFSGLWASFVQGIEDALAGMGEFFTAAWQGIVDTVTGVWDTIVQTVVDKFESIKKTVQDGVEKLKGFFNFKWELPKIKLPHFSITGSFSLKPPSVPHFGVDWYAKGGILTRPTIFGMQDASLLGGGEAGPEAVLPIDKLRDYISEAMRAQSGGGDFNQTVIVNSPEELTPSEVARQTRNATKAVFETMKGF